MRIFNRYLLFLVLAAGGINSFLAFMGQQDISVYFIVNVIAFLIITILHAYLNPRARQLMNVISLVLFAGFMTVVVIKVLEII